MQHIVYVLEKPPYRHLRWKRVMACCTEIRSHALPSQRFGQCNTTKNTSGVVSLTFATQLARFEVYIVADTQVQVDTLPLPNQCIRPSDQTIIGGTEEQLNRTILECENASRCRWGTMSFFG